MSVAVRAGVGVDEAAKQGLSGRPALYLAGRPQQHKEIERTFGAAHRPVVHRPCAGGSQDELSTKKALTVAM
jgi:hypothetical protein